MSRQCTEAQDSTHVYFPATGDHTDAPNHHSSPDVAFLLPGCQFRLTAARRHEVGDMGRLIGDHREIDDKDSERIG